MLSHKEMTAHIRKRIKISGIKATVRMLTVCGSKVIQVNIPQYPKEFSPEDQKRIREIAVNNNLTWVRGLEIDVNQHTNPYTFNFYYGVHSQKMQDLENGIVDPHYCY